MARTRPTEPDTAAVALAEPEPAAEPIAAPLAAALRPLAERPDGADLLRRLAADFQGQAGRRAAQYGAGNTSAGGAAGDLRGSIVAVWHALEERDKWLGHLAALLRLRGEPAGPTPAEPRHRETHRLLSESGRRDYLDAAPRLRDALVANLRRDLAERAAVLANQADSLRAGNQFSYRMIRQGEHFSVAGYLDQAVPVAERVAELTVRLGTLENHSAVARAAQAAAVSAIAADCRGAERLADSYRAALLLDNALYPRSARAGELAAAEAEARRLAADSARLEDDDAHHLADALAAAEGRVRALKGELKAEVTAGLLAVVLRAMDGEEGPRAELEASARARPEAWPSGLAPRLAAAAWPMLAESAVIIEVLHEAAGPKE